MDIAVLIGEIAYISRYRILDGILDAAKKDGNNIMLFTCEGFLFHGLKDYSFGEYKIFELPALERYDGIIVDLDSIENKKMQEYLYDNISHSNVPCVSFNRELSNANEIYFDNKKGLEELMEHLIVHHKLEDFFYLSGPFGNRDAMERLETFRAVMEKHGLPVNKDRIYEGDFNYGSGKEAAKKYLDSGKKLPQAFVAANDYMAVGLMEELKANGVRIPEDVVVTGYDSSELSDYITPRLATVDRCEYEAGVLAYKKLLANISEAEERSCSIVSGKFHPAASCGCAMVEEKDENHDQSIVELKMHMDENLDLIKALTLRLTAITKQTEYQQVLKSFIEKIGIEYFYFCQCGSRESYYEELEILASGKKVRRNMTVYQDTVWCPVAYEKGEMNNYPSYSRRLLFPPNSQRDKKGGYYIIMPVHQGKICIGYSIIGNFNNALSGRVLQHLIIGIEENIGNSRKNDIMTTMLARINQKWQYDELTGLYNRSGLLQNVEKLLSDANNEKMGVCVMFFDLDGLKAINDTEGHEAGDRYICAMAEALEENMGSEDVACRYGGDEYIVVSKQRSRDECMEILDDFRKTVANVVSFSAGCEFDYITDMGQLNELIESADKKMYEQKRKRKRWGDLA